MEYKLEGTKEILESLDALAPKETLALIKGASRKALNEKIIKPLRAALPYSAKTKKSIKIIADKEDRKTGLWAGVSSDAFWLRFTEYGTKVREWEGRSRGQITAKPVIKPTILKNVDGVIDFFNNDFGQDLIRLMQRKLKRISK